MAVYMVTYDLNNPGQRYDDVIQAIKEASTGVWCTYRESSYLIQSNLSVQQVFDRIAPHLDSNDKLLIIEVKENYQGWLENNQWEYIRENIFS